MDFISITATTIWISGFIYAIIFAFSCMAVAGAKGYSKGSWWFIGLLLGIIGLIIIACFPSKEVIKDIPAKPKYHGL